MFNQCLQYMEITDTTSPWDSNINLQSRLQTGFIDLDWFLRTFLGKRTQNLILWYQLWKFTKSKNNIYRPPKYLRKGNIFSRICLSVCLSIRGFPCDYYPWCIGPYCTGPLPDMGPQFPWPSPSAAPMKVGKRGVHSLLECFLVKFM